MPFLIIHSFVQERGLSCLFAINGDTLRDVLPLSSLLSLTLVNREIFNAIRPIVSYFSERNMVVGGSDKGS